MLENLHNYLFEQSTIYRNYYWFSVGRDSDGRFKWMPFQVVRDAYRNWYEFMIDGNECSEWWFWIILNDYREHDEMGYFPYYPNSFTSIER